MAKSTYLLRILLLLFVSISTASVTKVLGQYPRAFVTSNYSALAGVAFNPANLADSRHRFAFVPFAFNAEITNNFVNVRTPYNQVKGARRKLDESLLDENGIPVFYNFYLEDKLNGKPKQAYVSAEVTAPSFMFSLPNKVGFGFSTKTRTFVHLKNLNEDLLKIFLEDFDSTAPGWSPNVNQLRYINKPNDQKRFGVGALAFQEFDFSVADVLLDEKEHFLRGGLTFKYLIGLGTANLRVNNLDYELQNVDSIQLNNADMTLNYVGEEYYTDPDRRLNDYFGKNKLGSGTAIDIGVIYEFRPKYKEYSYKMDRRNEEDRTANKYLFKVGASISDFGRIRFKNLSYARHRDISSDTITDWEQFNSAKSLGGSEDIDSFLFTLFPNSDSSNQFNAKLPASLNLMFDWQIRPRWFAGATYIQTLRGNKVLGVRKQNTLSLNGRYESRKFEAGTNLVLGRFYNPVLWGMYLRWGPLYLGTDNLGGIFTLKSTNGFNLFAGLQFSILHKKISDMDGDQVSDAKDACPSIPGSDHADGCPDQDNDHVPDDIDLCPTIAGTKRTKGCPDPDGDGLVLSEDKCPDKAGPKKDEGCPDTDGDGLADHLDNCPEEEGLEINQGCPEMTAAEDTTLVDETLPNEPTKEIIKTEKTSDEKTVVKEKETPSTKASGSDKSLSVNEVLSKMDHSIYDYYLILGVYENKTLADNLVKRLNKEAGVMCYIYMDSQNGLNYVTFGRTTGENSAKEQLDKLDIPDVNNLINGHVWWKKVPK